MFGSEHEHKVDDNGSIPNSNDIMYRIIDLSHFYMVFELFLLFFFFSFGALRDEAHTQDEEIAMSKINARNIDFDFNSANA